MSKSEDHLPLYGPGPLYVGTIVVLTVAAIAGSLVGVLPVTRSAALVWPMRIAGAALVAGGIALWVAAVFGAKIDEGIEGNHLVTAGAYALVRNPIYTAFSLVCTGVLLAFEPVAPRPAARVLAVYDAPHEGDRGEVAARALRTGLR